MEIIKDENIYVYVGAIPKSVQITELSCQARNEEISACANERVRKERYCVWKLLEYALRKTQGDRVDLSAFEKLPSGKWASKDICFSLSHSGDMAAVALSLRAVGVDVERGKEKLLRLQEKILCEAERAVFARLTGEDKERYLLEKWTQKEAIFKAYGENGFVPREVDTQNYQAATKWEERFGEEYCVSVVGEGIENVRWCSADEYLDR